MFSLPRFRRASNPVPASAPRSAAPAQPPTPIESPGALLTAIAGWLTNRGLSPSVAPGLVLVHVNGTRCRLRVEAERREAPVRMPRVLGRDDPYFDRELQAAMDRFPG